jgi:hypothetical protein
MKHFVKMLIKRTIFIVAFAVITVALSAQEGSMQAYEEAKKEITDMKKPRKKLQKHSELFLHYLMHFQNMPYTELGNLSKN